MSRGPALRRLALLGCLLRSCAEVWAAANCPALDQSERARLVSYLRKKLRIPKTSGIAIASASVVGSSCHWRLRFESTDPKSSWSLELFLSPDHRFLTRELLDTRIDPVKEERRQEQALAQGLTHGDFPALGPAAAPVTLVVFSDFQCPYCARFANMLKSEVLPAEGKRIRVIFRHLPLPMHTWARTAAEYAACAQSQGDQYFWAVHDFVFGHQRELSTGNLRGKVDEYVAKLPKLDRETYKRCVSEGAASSRIDRDVAFAKQNGITGTPTLFVNGRRVGSVVGAEQIRTLIRQYAASAEWRSSGAR